jgi:hypothetical protein
MPHRRRFQSRRHRLGSSPDRHYVLLHRRLRLNRDLRQSPSVLLVSSSADESFSSAIQAGTDGRDIGTSLQTRQSEQ